MLSALGKISRVGRMRSIRYAVFIEDVQGRALWKGDG